MFVEQGFRTKSRVQLRPGLSVGQSAAQTGLEGARHSGFPPVPCPGVTVPIRRSPHMSDPVARFAASVFISSRVLRTAGGSRSLWGTGSYLYGPPTLCVSLTVRLFSAQNPRLEEVILYSGNAKSWLALRDAKPVRKERNRKRS